ncbi:MAG: 2-hydroxyacid dehydrogenase [Dehalococcoidia bacterium]|tara:strand:+ start:1185 stop:2183 length:999 start_codon:yes stop_codon:yes gene_type:complete
MPNTKPYNLIVIPDDEPVVLKNTTLADKVYELADKVEWHTTRPLTDDQTIELIKDADAVINIRGSVQFNKDVLSCCPNLKLISVWGTGVNHVDLEFAESKGIWVSNTPAYGAPYVAEQALALGLSVGRQIVSNHNRVVQGGWTAGYVNEFYNKTLGVIGTGAIGQRMIELGKALGMKVIAWTFNPTPERASQYGISFVEFDDLLKNSDVISLHIPATSESVNLIDEREFKLMKDTCIVINTARGDVINQDALISALNNNTILGAGLDVFPQEPLPENHPLTTLPNVVISPHVGGMAEAATMKGLEMTIDNLQSFAEGKPLHVVAKGSDDHLG